MLRYLHFLAKIAYFAICICTPEPNGGDKSKIVYSQGTGIYCQSSRLPKMETQEKLPVTTSFSRNGFFGNIFQHKFAENGNS